MVSSRNDSRRWQRANVPVPKSHIVALVAGFALQRIDSRQLPVSRRTALIIGTSSIGLNVLIIGWAILTLGRIDSRDPDQLVTSGPYGFSRNPMYVAWTGLYVGLAVLFRSFWVLSLAPFVAIAVHITVRREEAELARSFGESYRSYQGTVPRYL